MIESKDHINVKTLIKLKFIDADASYSEQGFLSIETDIVIFNKVLTKLAQFDVLSEFKFDSNSLVTERDFYIIAISLLGYEIGIDYCKDNVIIFANSIGLSPICNSKYTNGDFFDNVIDLLKSKTKDGIDYFEKLCINGVFKDYNENKDIPEILVFNGKTQPVFDYKESIFEKVYVETPLDTDKDNERDLIAVYIRRPIETNMGMKVPVIYVASPYMMGCNEDLYQLHNVDHDLEVFPETHIEYEDIKYIEIKEELPKQREVL